MTFTGAIHARLMRPVRVGKPLEARGRIERDTTRVLEVTVAMTQEATACFRGRFTLAMLDEKGAERVIGGPLPEEWKRFAR